MSDRLIAECAPPTEAKPAKEWPREIVEALQRVGVINPLTCGQNRHGYKWGCDEPLHDPEDRYKCVDCDVTFHRKCARKHFLDSGSEVEKLRNRIFSIVDANRPDATAEIELLLDLLEREALR